MGYLRVLGQTSAIQVSHRPGRPLTRTSNGALSHPQLMRSIRFLTVAAFCAGGALSCREGNAGEGSARTQQQANPRREERDMPAFRVIAWTVCLVCLFGPSLAQA